MATTEDSRRLLTANEVAARLNLSAFTLSNWRSRRFGPAFIRCGRRVMYRVEDVQAFVQARRVETSGGTA